MTFLEELAEQGRTDPIGAAVKMTKALMRGDPATLKAGYTLANALIAAAEMFRIVTIPQMALVVERVVDETTEHHSPTNRPLVILNITGGVEQWTIASPGLGDPEVFIFDFDDEMDTDDKRFTLDRWNEVIALARGRVSDAVMAEMVQSSDDLAEQLRDSLVYEATAGQQAEERTKRERAAALLSDAEVDGILDAHNWPVDHEEGE